ncbi:methionine--tRNA ligase [Candidatus Collierbacteria bacterium]|nr:methionine--tRNA ligase [Candidatus Collierbacteria bacterium]
MVKANINYEDFAKLDIRAGLIVGASAPEWSEKLIRYEIDLGEEIGKRILFSGIRKWYRPEDLVGKKVPVVVNLEPKKMGEEESAGMVIMTDGEDGAVMIFLSEKIKPGTVVR